MRSAKALRILMTASAASTLLCSTSFAATTASDSSGTTTPSVALPMGGTSAAGQAAQSSDNSAQMAAAMMAAAMASQCNQPPGNVAPCIMAALAAMQAAAAGQAADGAGTTAGQYATTTGGATAVTLPTNGTAGTSASVTATKQLLASKGVAISADGSTISLPGGQSVPLDASSATDTGGGLSAAQIAQGQATLADVQKKMGGAPVAKVETGETGSQGGGGGGGGGAYSPSYASTKIKPRTKPNLSGLTKNLGNDKIGVAADNIFEMITRRYQAKDATGTFLKN